MKKTFRFTLGLFLMLPLLMNATFVRGKTSTNPAAAPDIPPSPGQITVMTWNIHGGNSEKTRTRSGGNNQCRIVPEDKQWGMTRFANRIKAFNNQGHKIDVLALQEVHREQANQLAKLLGYEKAYFIWNQNCDVHPNPRPGATHSQLQYGSAILSPHPLLDIPAKSYWLPTEAPEDLTHKSYARLGAASIDVAGGGRIRIYNTHLTANPEFVEFRHQEWLQKQVLAFKGRMSEDEAKYGTPFHSILMMDFNTRPFNFDYQNGTPAYLDLVVPGRGGMFTDAWRWGHPEDYAHPDRSGFTLPASSVETNPYAGRFDYVFLKNSSSVPNFNITSAAVLNICVWKNTDGSCYDSLSDHRPVVITFAFHPIGTN